MQKIRRYSRNARVVTEVQPSYKPASEAAAQTFDHMRKGFETGVKFLRPAVEQEQTTRGEKEALAAIDDDSFEMRKPFSLRDAAFNQTGERVITNRVMINLDEEMNAALRKADGRVSVLNAEMERIRGEVGGGLPQINGLAARWTESFERGVSTATRQTTELAQRRAIAAQRQAAADAAARAENEIARLALTAGTPEELAAALTDGTTSIAQYGPRGEFELNGVTYPADASRSGILSTRQLTSMAQGLQLEAHEIFLRADYERSDSPAQWAGEFRRSVLAGESPIPPAQALRMLGQFESMSRADENARLASERAIERDMATAAEAGLAPFLTAQENGVIVPIAGEQRQTILDAVAGNARLTGVVNDQLAAADAVAELQNVPQNQRAAYIENAFGEFAATDGINATEAAVIEQLAPYLEQAKAAVTRETVGINAAEQILNSGGTLSDEQIAEMRVNAAGNPVVQQSIDTIVDAQSIIASTEGMSGVQREEVLNNLDGALAEMAIEGGLVGAAAQRRLKGLETAQTHFATLEDQAQNDVFKFAQSTGVELVPLISDETSSLVDVAQNIALRVAAIRPQTAQYDNDTPVPLSSGEKELISDMLREGNNTQRVEFMSAIRSTGGAQSQAIFAKLGVDNPPLVAAARVAPSNDSAMRAILAGMNMNISVPNNTVQGAEMAISGLIMSGNLPPTEIASIRTTAEAYAKGIAARSGATEVVQADLEKGYDIALGADENGNGGIETVGKRGFGSYGTAILPTGVSGDVVGTLLDPNLNEANIQGFAGGFVIDGMGRNVAAADLRRSIAGFRNVVDDEGTSMLVPTMADGSLFMVRDPDGATSVFMFDPRSE